MKCVETKSKMSSNGHHLESSGIPFICEGLEAGRILIVVAQVKVAKSNT